MMLSYQADFPMVDQGQLQKFEELLEKLPEKPQARVQHPVSVLLSGIEGFDTERASECLGKLLDKHYDTIGVLKLATKQDLVEDAGILPGDALRIVAAAKNYVSPRDGGHSPESTLQNDASKPGDVVVPSEAHHVQGVEAHRPPALREKGVIFTPAVASQASTHQIFPREEESCKSEEQVAVNGGASGREIAIYVKKANQGATPPKHTKDVLAANDAQVPAQIYPIPVGITYPHICRICNVKCISEANCRMHYNGRTHRAKFAEAVKEVEQPAPAVKETKKDAQTQQVVWEAKQPMQSTAVDSFHACGICNVKCTSNVVIRSHFNGRKHAQNLELATDSDDNSPTPYLHCSICNVNSTCKRNLVMHFNGKKHAKCMQIDGDSFYHSGSENDC